MRLRPAPDARPGRAAGLAAGDRQRTDLRRHRRVERVPVVVLFAVNAIWSAGSRVKKNAREGNALPGRDEAR
jgi:hypothetical protein